MSLLPTGPLGQLPTLPGPLAPATPQDPGPRAPATHSPAARRPGGCSNQTARAEWGTVWPAGARGRRSGTPPCHPPGPGDRAERSRGTRAGGGRSATLAAAAAEPALSAHLRSLCAAYPADDSKQLSLKNTTPRFFLLLVS